MLISRHLLALSSHLGGPACPGLAHTHRSPWSTLPSVTPAAAKPLLTAQLPSLPALVSSSSPLPSLCDLLSYIIPNWDLSLQHVPHPAVLCKMPYGINICWLDTETKTYWHTVIFTYKKQAKRWVATTKDNLISLDFIMRCPVVWKVRNPFPHLMQEQPTLEMVSVGLATQATSSSKRSFSMVLIMLSYLMSRESKIKVSLSPGRKE